MDPDEISRQTLFGRLVNFHVLRDSQGIYLIDAGFIGGVSRLEKYLAEIDLSLADICAILLTHGHLDHTLNVAEIQARSDCLVYAPAADRDHIAGSHRYRGANRLCGFAETIGRLVLRYQPPQIDHWFQSGETFDDIWGGLEVIPLPGHTSGHSGFFSRSNQALFAGDLFSAYGPRPKVPPHFLNTDSEQARRSIIEAATICEKRKIRQVLLNHSSVHSAEAHLQHLNKLATALQNNTNFDRAD